MMSWLKFGETLVVNGWYASGIQTISDENRLDITPVAETFEIWGVIYYGLFMTLLTTEHLNGKKEAALFNRSMTLNQRWLAAFSSRENIEAIRIMKHLRCINSQLVCYLREKGINNYYIEMYNTWVNAMSALSETIVNKDDPCFDAVDAIYQTIENTYNGKRISYAEKITLQWTIQGIKIKNRKFDVLKRALFPFDTEVTFGELFGIENKSMSWFRLPKQVIPISRNLPPSLVEFGGNKYHITHTPEQIEYNGFYYERLSKEPHDNSQDDEYDGNLFRGGSHRKDKQPNCCDCGETSYD